MTTPRFRYRPRRRDRAVEDERWLERFLERAPVGVLATVDGGEPFAHGNLFVFDAARRTLHLHTARRGHTRDQARTPRPAAFHAFALGRLLPAPRAVDFSVEYASVTAYGTLTLVLDEAEAQRELHALMAKYAPSWPIPEAVDGASAEDLARTSVLRLSVTRLSGKRNRKPGAEGAYRYPVSDADLLDDPPE